jgi:hypothetical protein
MELPNIPKKGKSTPARMDILSGDIQGPFRITSSEGTTSNVKFVDSATKYVKMFGIADKSSTTVLSVFKPLLLRLERRTGDKCKYFRCDDGTEFKGEFHDYLESLGIQKQRGLPYEHHIPPLAENLHKQIMNRARTMLIASKLPKEYYLDAQLTAVYLWNREAHSGIDKTPYELIYNRRPNVSNLVPFGCVGYAFLRREIRNKPDNDGKLHDTSVKCRLLGYGDDDDSEEVAGFKVLVEANPPYVTYSKNVKWDIHAKIEPLPAVDCHIDENDLDNLFGNVEFIFEDDFVPNLLESTSTNDQEGISTNTQESVSTNNNQDGISTDAQESTINNEQSTSPPEENLAYLTKIVKETYGSVLNSEKFITAEDRAQTLWRLEYQEIGVPPSVKIKPEVVL